MSVDIFSFCTPYLWEIIADDVPVVFEFFKKEKKKEKRGKEILLSELWRV